MDTLSIIIPCYCEEQAIPIFYTEITALAEQLPQIAFDFLFVDDGSTDSTLKVLQELSLTDERVRYLSFSRNFGKEAAIYAGLKHAQGDYVCIMDVDLQDPPALIPELYEAVKHGGYDCAATRRVSRTGEPPIRSFFAHTFYRLIHRISSIDIVDGARDYRLMNRGMVDAILEITEYNRFSKGIFAWVGFKTKWFEYENIARAAGETKWSFWKLFLYSIEGIIGFSTAPLAISSIIGIALCFLSFLAILIIIVRQLIWGGSAYGWPSLVCIIFMLSGIQLFSIGILGQYLSKTYLETKRRPIYLVRCKN